MGRRHFWPRKWVNTPPYSMDALILHLHREPAGRLSNSSMIFLCFDNPLVISMLLEFGNTGFKNSQDDAMNVIVLDAFVSVSKVQNPAQLEQQRFETVEISSSAFSKSFGTRKQVVLFVAFPFSNRSQIDCNSGLFLFALFG